ncbi:hypothetical protein AAGG49_22000, partial [Stenotrophomonas maltophilia]|uniref:hypothetical protein n=1 Tax=Stenotrophomonas maltophilia TaxID=40324 RepID=UPI00313AA295
GGFQHLVVRIVAGGMRPGVEFVGLRRLFVGQAFGLLMVKRLGVLVFGAGIFLGVKLLWWG